MALTEAEELELLELEEEEAKAKQSQALGQPVQEGQNQQLAQQVTQKPDRFQLAYQTPGNNYSYGDAALDTLKTLINSSADLGQNISQPILHPGQTLQGIGQALTHPGQTLWGIGQYIGDRYGSMEKMANTVSTDPFGFGSDVVSSTMLGRVVGKVGVVLKNEKLAGNVINSLIKPSHKEFLFGKNPGLGVAKEGITAKSMEELYSKVDERTTVLNKAATEIRNTPENINKTVDLSKIKQPLINAREELLKAPKIHATEIKNIEDAIDDISNLNNGNLGTVSISDAYKVKDVVSKMQSWTTESKAGLNLNKGLKQVYGSIDKTIDAAIPELEKVNSRMADLISAKQAIRNRMEVLSRQEGMPTLMKLVDLPFAAIKTTTAKTTLGKLLAKQYSLPKK